MYSLDLYEISQSGDNKRQSQIPPSMSTSIMEVDISDENQERVKLQFRDNHNDQYLTRVFDKLSFSDHQNKSSKKKVEMKKPQLVDKLFTRHENVDDDIESFASDKSSQCLMQIERVMKPFSNFETSD